MSRPESGSSAAPTVDAALVEAATTTLSGVTALTPLERSARLSEKAGADVWLKREDLQPVRSYKLRGAYNLIAQLKDAGAGVVCASAGNHAQGVAYACAALGIRGRIYLPGTTPRQKRERIAAIGGSWAEIVIEGDTYDDAHAAAIEHASDSGAQLVPAFDDPRTIAGQGTVAVEIVEQLGRAPDNIVVPVGGGGLLAGVVAWASERHPDIAFTGIEPAGAACMGAALSAGKPVALDELDPFVDGAAVRQAGDLTFAIIKDNAQLITVDTGAVCAEMLALYQSDGIIAEPAGALASAAIGQAFDPAPGSVTVCVLSGGNNDVSRYAEIIERSLIFEGVKHYFLVDFPQEPGMLRRFLDDVLGPEDDITLFEYVKRSNRETGPAIVGIEIGRKDDLPGLLARMREMPFHVEPIDPNSAIFRLL